MVVFDTEALLIFYLGERGADAVEVLLNKIQEKQMKGFLNIVNLTELYYILYRKDPVVANEKILNLKAFDVKIVPLAENGIWRETGRIKGTYAIPLADTFAAATAIVKRDKLVVGTDEDFRKVDVQLMKVR